MRVPIITYHAIGNHQSPLWTAPEIFEQQLKTLSNQGWRTLSIADLVSSIKLGKPIAEKSLIITFDDGYESVYSHALPRLKEFGFSATVFLITGHCGLTNQWPGQPPTVPLEQLLNWDQVAKLAEYGLEIGAHTRSHAALTTLPPDQVVEELAISQETIERKTGTRSRVFAYPYGQYNSSVIHFVRRHFDGAVGTSLGLVEDNCDLYLLPRIDAYYLRNRWVGLMNKNRFREYLRIRQALRLVRRMVYPDWRPENADIEQAATVVTSSNER